MQDSLSFLGFVAAIMVVGVVGGNTLFEIWEARQRQQEQVEDYRRALGEEREAVHQRLRQEKEEQEAEFREFCRKPIGDPAFQEIIWFEVDTDKFKHVDWHLLAKHEDCEVLHSRGRVFIGKRSGSFTKSAQKKL